MMETVVNSAAATKHHPQPYSSPHLKKVLKTYQLSALRSLSGPSTVLASEEASAKLDNGKGLLLPPTQIKKEVLPTECERHDTKQNIIENETFLTPAPFPIQQQPILTTPDQSKSERTETILEGETISCFIVGGERRLCLPQILNTVLSEFTLAEINKQCDRLQIFCSRCNSKQLEVLKVSNILPNTAPSCGLITQTDAERLCSALLHCHAPRAQHSKASSGYLSFRVYHECFGECQGILTPALYTDRNARCIECTECRCIFTPKHFVCHAHQKLENQTCHWGFDSTNWRSYLLLTEGQPNSDILTTALKDFKERYLNVNKTSSSSSAAKRKQVESMVAEVKEEPNVGKRPRLHDTEAAAAAAFNAAYLYDPFLYAAASWYHPETWSRLPANTAPAAAFRPWHLPAAAFAKDAAVLKALHQQQPTTAALREPLPSFLSQGPPVLLHPERVVPLSESERFERQPNVALAPAAAQQLLLHRLPPHHEVKKEVEEEVAAEPTPTSPPPPPVYNPEIELSSDTEDSSSERGGADAETTELLERLARSVARCGEQQDEVRQQGEAALRSLGVDLLAAREARTMSAADNQLLRERLVELEEKLKTTTALHAKELNELNCRLVACERQRCQLEHELSRQKSRESSPPTSVITSAPAASPAAASVSPPAFTIKSEPDE